MIEVYQRQPVIKRLPTFISRTEGIQLYTKNNVYPQLVKEIKNRSYTVKSACERLSTFIAGDGFEDQAVGSLVVNEKGNTLNEILKKVSIDASVFSGSFAIYLKVNALGQFNDISVWPFEYFRLGLPNENGDVFNIKYNSNWERDPYKEIDNTERIFTYPVFNPNQEEIQARIEDEGINYPGQVYYFTPDEDQYPLATFDSVLDQAQTQEEIGIFRLSSIQNGLQAGAVFSYPGTFEDESSEKKFKDKLNKHKGGKGANSIIVVEDPDGQRKAADLVTPLTIQNSDKIHEFISRDDKEAIMEAFAMPKEILGVLPTSGMFNIQMMQESYIYYNTITRDYRENVSNALRKIFTNWHTPVGDNFKIKPQQYSNG